MTIYIRYLVAIWVFLCSYSCQTNVSNSADGLFDDIPVPTAHSGEPNLFLDHNGQVYLSWIEYLNDSTDALFYAQLMKDKWSSAQEISRSSNWFVNWADFPSLVKSSGSPSFFAAHYLEMSAKGTYDYDIKVSLSSDGQHWADPLIPHTDGIAAEHGFVSLLPLDNGNILAAWLDGRNTKTGHSEDSNNDPGHDHEHRGAMTLRTAEIDAKGNLSEEYELDSRVCDCCQTDAARTNLGPIIVYRDRSDKEIRDISMVRKINGIWQNPSLIHEDNWQIGGCPVNGPAISALGQSVVVAWYTESDQVPKLLYATSTDGGTSFSQAKRGDDGQPLGRIDVVHKEEHSIILIWIEKNGEDAVIKFRSINSEGTSSESLILQLVNSSRKSGFPKAVIHENDLIMAWTDANKSGTAVKTLKVSLN